MFYSKSVFITFFFALVFLFSSNIYSQRYWNVAAQFTGSDSSYVAVDPSTTLDNLTGDFTIECWLNADTNWTGSVFGKKNVRLMIQETGEKFRLRIQTANSTKIYSRTSALLELHKWYHVACTYDESGSGSMKVYVNGNLDSSRTGTGIGAVSYHDSLFIGLSEYGPFKGMIDDIRIWNRALSQSEIKMNMRNPYPGALNNKGANFGTGLVMSCTFDFTYSGAGSSLYFYDGSNHYLAHNVFPIYLGASPSQTLVLNNSLELSNSGDYAVMANNADIELSGPLSAEAWIYPINSASGKQYIITKGNDYAVYLEDTGKLRFVFNGHVGTSISTIPSNQWTHIAITFNSTGAGNLYINGKYDVDYNFGAPTTANTDSLFIGTLGGAYYFKGYIDAVKISNYEKNENEIKKDMFRIIDYYNKPNPPNSTVSLDFDFNNYPTTGNGTFYYLRGNAKYSTPVYLNDVPVSPILGSYNGIFPNGYYFKSSDRRIPQSNTAGYTEEDSLNVTSSTNISDLNMFIAINHDKLSDLQIILFSPDGDSVIIWDNISGLTGNVDNLITIFDDESENEALNYKYVDFGPNIKPANSLNSAFAGKNPKGIWRLKIVDFYNGNIGHLYGWGLRFNNVTGVENNNTNTVPSAYKLDQNYPNPFNPSTTINYALPKASNVKLIIYNLLGQEVTTLVNSFNQAGKHSVNFNAANLASGVYIYSIKADGFTASKKLMLLK